MYTRGAAKNRARSTGKGRKEKTTNEQSGVKTRATRARGAYSSKGADNEHPGVRTRGAGSSQLAEMEQPRARATPSRSKVAENEEPRREQIIDEQPALERIGEAPPLERIEEAPEEEQIVDMQEELRIEGPREQEPQRDFVPDYSDTDDDSDDDDDADLSADEAIHDSNQLENQATEVHVMQGSEGGVTEMTLDPKVIRIVDGCFLGNTAAQEITKIFKSFFPAGAYPTWRKVDADDKRNLWEKFQEKFSWLPEEDALVYRVWYKTANKRYKGTLCSARRDAKKAAGTEDIAGTRDHHPKFIAKDVWGKLIDECWGKEEYKIKCKKAAQNRLSRKHGTVSTHTGGSVNFSTHKLKLEEERKRPVGRHEVYLRTHKKQKGKGPFVDNKSAVVEEKYKELLLQKHGPDAAADEAFWDTALWMEATGGPSKGALYGQGSSSMLSPPARPSITSSAGSTSSVESQVIEDRIRAKVREEMREEVDRQVQEKLAAAVEAKLKEHNEKIDLLMKALNVKETVTHESAQHNG